MRCSYMDKDIKIPPIDTLAMIIKNRDIRGVVEYHLNRSFSS